MTNLAKITNQASDRHKNNKCLTRKRDGVPKKLTKITKKANPAQISNLSGNSSKKQFLRTKNNKSNETSNQASDRFKNDNCSRQRGEGLARNIKLTKLFCMLKIANKASGTFSKPVLETIPIVSVTSGHG